MSIFHIEVRNLRPFANQIVRVGLIHTFHIYNIRPSTHECSSNEIYSYIKYNMRPLMVNVVVIIKFIITHGSSIDHYLMLIACFLFGIGLV